MNRHICARKSNTGKHLSKGLLYLTFGNVVFEFVNQTNRSVYTKLTEKYTEVLHQKTSNCKLFSTDEQ